MKYYKIVFLGLIFLCFADAYGQDTQNCKYKVEGHVYDLATNEPLPFATIRIEGTSKGVVADIDGYFYLNSICEEEFDLEFAHIGYKKVVHHHDVHHKLPKIYLAPENVTLQSVIVEGEVETGDLISGTVSKISAKELAVKKGESFGNLAGLISGVTVMKTGQNVVKPVIHGLHSNRILIINNGVRHEFQSWGSDHAPEIDGSMAENIEVIKGAATVRYGPDALGGVIIVNPARMELLDPLNGKIEGTYATNGRAGSGNFLIKKGFHKVALLTEGSYQRQGDLHTPDYNLTNTGKKEYSLGIGARYHHKNLDFTARYSRLDQEMGILRGSVTGNLRELEFAMTQEPPADTKPFDYKINNPKQVVKHDMLKLNASISKEHSVINFQYAYQNNHRQEYDIRRGTMNELPAINLQMATHTFDVDWKHPEKMGWSGIVGVQAFYQDNNNIYGTQTIPFIPNFNNYRIGAFIIESKELAFLTFEWGLRYDYQYASIRSSQPIHENEPVFQNVTATVGINKQFGQHHYFSSNIGSAWRPPSISELYSFGKHQNVVQYGLLRAYYDENGELETNEILEVHKQKSEKGLKWINTYGFKNRRVEGEITGYINYIRDYIFSKPAGITTTQRGAFPFFIYDQSEGVFTGMDFSLAYFHNRIVSSHFRGSFLWARDIKRDDYFVDTPPPSVGYKISVEKKKLFFLTNLNLSLETEYTFESIFNPRVIPAEQIIKAKEEGEEIFSKNDNNFDFMAPPEGYFLVGIDLSANLKNFFFVFRIKNILNREYRSYTDRMRYFSDDIGRNFLFTVQYNF